MIEWIRGYLREGHFRESWSVFMLHARKTTIISCNYITWVQTDDYSIRRCVRYLSDAGGHLKQWDLYNSRELNPARYSSTIPIPLINWMTTTHNRHDLTTHTTIRLYDELTHQWRFQSHKLISKQMHKKTYYFKFDFEVHFKIYLLQKPWFIYLYRPFFVNAITHWT